MISPTTVSPYPNPVTALFVYFSNKDPKSLLRPGNKRQHPPKRRKPQHTRPGQPVPMFEAHLELEIDRHRPPSTPLLKRPSFAAGNQEQRSWARQSQGYIGADPGAFDQSASKGREQRASVVDSAGLCPAGEARRSARTGWHPADAALHIRGRRSS